MKIPKLKLIPLPKQTIGELALTMQQIYPPESIRLRGSGELEGMGWVVGDTKYVRAMPVIVEDSDGYYVLIWVEKKALA